MVAPNTSLRADDVRLVWIDLETTGLDPSRGLVLEVGVIITDLGLCEFARRSVVFRHPRQEILEVIDDVPLRMHAASGLLLECFAADGVEGVPTWASWHQVIDLVTAHRRRGFRLHLAGSSVHFDRAWLAEHCPALLELCHHRILDVSGYLVAFPGLLGDYSSRPVAHRAIADLEFSIEQHRAMRALLGLQEAPLRGLGQEVGE